MKVLPVAAVLALLIAVTGHVARGADLDETQVLRFGVVKGTDDTRYLLMTVEPPEDVSDTAEVAAHICGSIGPAIDRLLEGRDEPRPQRIVFEVQYRSPFLLFLTKREVSFHTADVDGDGCNPSTLGSGAPISATQFGGAN